MSEMNDRFLEAYKQLDKICREMFNSDKGVTAYIDEMYEHTEGDRYVSDWKAVLTRLKQYRHIRNSYAHEVGTTGYDICTVDDILWLNIFYQRILRRDDPLAIYYNIINSKHSNNISENRQWVEVASDEFSEINNAKKPLERTYGIYSGWFILVSVILVLIAVIVFVLTVIL